MTATCFKTMGLLHVITIASTCLLKTLNMSALNDNCCSFYPPCLMWELMFSAFMRLFKCHESNIFNWDQVGKCWQAHFNTLANNLLLLLSIIHLLLLIPDSAGWYWNVILHQMVCVWQQIEFIINYHSQILILAWSHQYPALWCMEVWPSPSFGLLQAEEASKNGKHNFLFWSSTSRSRSSTILKSVSKGGSLALAPAFAY